MAISESELKSAALGLGADACGIAPVERFSEAPQGFHPKDIYAGCKSVLVFAKSLPAGSLSAAGCIPYTYFNQIIVKEVDELTLALSRRLEAMGIKNVPVPSDDPSEYWEPERLHARGILSLRHAGMLAGLGTLGKNTLLINSRFGSMMQMGALLLDKHFEGDPIENAQLCKEGCGLCMKSCPASALDGTTVDQKACRARSSVVTERGFLLKKCYECRRVCPANSGPTA